VSTRSFWPPLQAAQVDYETLRADTLDHGGLPASLAAARFARRGLAGLITWPSAEPVFAAELLPAGYEFLLDLVAGRDPDAALSVRGRR